MMLQQMLVDWLKMLHYPYSLVRHFLEKNYYEQPPTVKENVFICDRR